MKRFYHRNNSETAGDTKISSRQGFDKLKSPSSKDSDDANSYRTSVGDIWALGITIVIGGQYLNFNAGLSAGFGSYSIATFFIGIAYICLCFCTSELSSALPFAGKFHADDRRRLLTDFNLPKPNLNVAVSFFCCICHLNNNSNIN